MSFGNFNETKDSGNEIKETNEKTDNAEKPRNQILESFDSREDDFDSKMDSVEKKENNTEKGEDTKSESMEKGEGEKPNLLSKMADKMRGLFSHKESAKETGDEVNKSENADTGNFNSKKEKFIDSIRYDVSPEENAEVSEKWSKKAESDGDSDDPNDMDADIQLNVPQKKQPEKDDLEI